jgi:hypothetical protein
MRRRYIRIDIYRLEVVPVGPPRKRLFLIKFSVEFAGDLPEFGDEARVPFFPAQPAKLSLRHFITDAPQSLTAVHFGSLTAFEIAGEKPYARALDL